MRSITRRALVLTQESAGHWFRRSLPPHVFSDPLPADVEAGENLEAARRWRLSGGDWKGFMAAYCASFVAITLFIA
ncbi:hypothetical protein [Novosphingobium sp. P6W]|uniref:hypothetical protein n=1 Tax=Novosphingobium sp. P6W TaxID=1609758 RepID=UPI0005C303A3|nr:hypothetical protein [Novosphingobium sp. P6W]AXB76228.1 hypothetical protein TQ38_006650 [Novosphingobium sp. P6W]KIS31397.1 hypothetical protein TQ38_16515 [Novosphingobium sp. P6W]